MRFLRLDLLLYAQSFHLQSPSRGSGRRGRRAGISIWRMAEGEGRMTRYFDFLYIRGLHLCTLQLYQSYPRRASAYPIRYQGIQLTPARCCAQAPPATGTGTAVAPTQHLACSPVDRICFAHSRRSRSSLVSLPCVCVHCSRAVCNTIPGPAPSCSSATVL